MKLISLKTIVPVIRIGQEKFLHKLFIRNHSIENPGKCQGRCNLFKLFLYKSIKVLYFDT